MQAYMKSTMPYYGIPTPVAPRALQIRLADVEFAAPKTGRRKSRYGVTPAFAKRYAPLAHGQSSSSHSNSFSGKDVRRDDVTGAWWDYVDSIASNRIGHPQDYPAPMRRKCSRGASPPICGSGAPPSSPNSASKRRPTSNSCLPASNPRLDRKSSSCARPSAGPPPVRLDRRRRGRSYVERNRERLSALASASAEEHRIE